MSNLIPQEIKSILWLDNIVPALVHFLTHKTAIYGWAAFINSLFVALSDAYKLVQRLGDCWGQ